MVEVSLFNNFIADSCSSTKATESANQIGIGILHAKLKLPPRSHIHATYSLRLCASPLSPSRVSFRLSAARLMPEPKLNRHRAALHSPASDWAIWPAGGLRATLLSFSLSLLHCLALTVSLFNP